MTARLDWLFLKSSMQYPASPEVMSGEAMEVVPPVTGTLEMGGVVEEVVLAVVVVVVVLVLAAEFGCSKAQRSELRPSQVQICNW
jgi:hypothetical protein